MKRKVDIVVGVFLIIGLACLAYLSITFGEVDFLGRDQYDVTAVFSDVSGLQVNTGVEMSGVKIGRVVEIELKDYRAHVRMRIDNDVDLPDPGTEARIVTEGLLGERYIAITPGHGRDDIPKDGTGEIVETQPPLLIEDLLSRFLFGEDDFEL